MMCVRYTKPHGKVTYLRVYRDVCVGVYDASVSEVDEILERELRRMIGTSLCGPLPVWWGPEISVTTRHDGNTTMTFSWGFGSGAEKWSGAEKHFLKVRVSF